MDDTRRDALARNLCCRICDERKTAEQLRTVDELLSRIERDDTTSLEDSLLSMLFDETEHPDDYSRGHNAAMRQAIRIAMVDAAVSVTAGQLPPEPSPDVIGDMAARLDVARTKSEELKREAERQMFDTSDTEPTQ